MAKVKALAGLLCIKRATDRDTWIDVGFCLRNESARTGVDFLEEWIVFSRMCPSKFKPGECEAQWAGMKPKLQGGFDIDTLRRWAEIDRPQAFKRLASDAVRSCDGSHNRVARVVKDLLGGRFVCANGTLWFKLLPSGLWTADTDGIAIRHELSTTIADAFVAVARERADDAASEMSWRSSSNNADDSLKKHMLKISCKLNDETFKDGVIKALREYFYDRDFLDKLDANPNLLAFSNGVWELKEKRFRQARADDFVSMNTGYDYCDDPDPEADAKIQQYWEMLHPDPGQREYIQKTFARQLYGDSGNELFHIHTGRNATASNGKTKFFEAVENSLGAYVGKFGIEILTAKQRIEPGKPMPIFETWRGKRILYCTEPNEDETVNSGIMKDLTGGEELQYRMLYANDIRRFRPQFKLHMMCNDTPRVDATDSGVKRRMTKTDYISQFVDPSEADPDNHRYPRDPALIQAFKVSDSLKCAFVRLLFRAYDHGFSFEKPSAVLASSKEFLEQNDLVLQFVESYIQKSQDQDGWFTLAEAKEALKNSEYNNNKPGSLKNALVRSLNTSCLPQKWFGQQKCTNVF